MKLSSNWEETGGTFAVYSLKMQMLIGIEYWSAQPDAVRTPKDTSTILSHNYILDHRTKIVLCKLNGLKDTLARLSPSLVTNCFPKACSPCPPRTKDAHLNIVVTCIDGLAF